MYSMSSVLIASTMKSEPERPCVIGCVVPRWFSLDGVAGTVGRAGAGAAAALPVAAASPIAGPAAATPAKN